jgi:hypothetical protein
MLATHGLCGNAPEGLTGLLFSLGTRGLLTPRLTKLHFGLRFVADHTGAAKCSLEALLRFFRAVLVILTGLCHGLSY